MKEIFKSKNFKPKKILKKLFLSTKDVKQLINDGHEIGLHSHSHPTNFSNLNYNQQLKEYKNNLNFLKNKVSSKKIDIISMSHPCGNYNKNTIKILKKMNIEIGFRQMMKKNINYKNYKINQSRYEIAREDHANIVKKFKL